MSERKQWGLSVAICALVVSCAMFRGPTVKDGKVCEQVDFGQGGIEICVGTMTQMQAVKAVAAERRERLGK